MGQLQMGTAVGRNSGRQETRREPINPALVTDRPLGGDKARWRRGTASWRRARRCFAVGGELAGKRAGYDKGVGKDVAVGCACSFGEGRFSWGSGVEMVVTEGLRGHEVSAYVLFRPWAFLASVKVVMAPWIDDDAGPWNGMSGWDGASEVLLDYVECGPAEICWSRKGREDDEDRSVTLATLFGSPRAQHGWARAMADNGQAAGGAGGWEQAGAGPSRPAWVNPGRGRRGAVPGSVGHD
ncbi:hypothetical protein C8F01DRAFT_1224578 [Mycena amicta]|nr:hypothetical protein C8F01DRAFT_1224578 [Mycena amicta]